MATDAPPGAGRWVPETTDLAALRGAARECRGCDLYKHAEQVVFGDGAARAAIMLVGEQPGDQEDRRGEPFVGPAGRVLDRALERAGVDRGDVWVTNAVKHFKFTRREGRKRRLHQKPERLEVVACRPWLLAETAAVRPALVVMMGATAAQALMGSGFRVTKRRGEVLTARIPEGQRVLATVHPSAILRGPKEDREAALSAMAADLRLAKRAV